MNRKILIIGLLVVILFGFLRLYNLISLPVFADEAIYIRWAQLMNQDFLRYKFFPIQDGKPPLQMMILALALRIGSYDPLLVSRLVSVVFGGISTGLFYYLVKILDGGLLARWMAVVLYLLIPYSLFHDRMGLIDTMLVTWLLISFIGFLMINRSWKWVWVIVAGFGYGLSLWTKTPAMFFIPIYLLLYLIIIFEDRSRWKQLLIRFAVAGLIGVGIYLLLRISPVFPSLLSRGEDFTFSISEVVGGEINHITKNASKIIRWMSVYVGIGVWLGVFAYMGLLFNLKKSSVNTKPFWLLGLAIIFCLPFLLLGRVIASRYFLPVIIFIIPAAALAIEQLWSRKLRWLVGLIIIMIGAQAIWFGVPLLFKVEATPFAREDVEQYLTSWSAGYGNAEVRDFIIDKASAGEEIVVATEGYFGTLPDGLLMYFDKSILIENIEIFGIGQPVREIPIEVIDKSFEKDTYLLVNEHRLLMEIDECCTLEKEYPRPRGGPSLLLIKVGKDDG